MFHCIHKIDIFASVLNLIYKYLNHDIFIQYSYYQISNPLIFNQCNFFTWKYKNVSRPYQIINPTIFTSRLPYSYCQCSGKCTFMMLFSTCNLFDNYMNRIISQIECMILMVRFQVRRKWTLRLSVKLQMFWLCLTNY